MANKIVKIEIAKTNRLITKTGVNKPMVGQNVRVNPINDINAFILAI